MLIVRIAKVIAIDQNNDSIKIEMEDTVLVSKLTGLPYKKREIRQQLRVYP